MPTNIDTVKTIIAHELRSANPEIGTHSVDQNDNSRGKNNIHFAASGKSRTDGDAVTKKGAEKAHMNPASKPDQMCLLPIKRANFLIGPFIR
jgi:hypothetical protein